MRGGGGRSKAPGHRNSSDLQQASVRGDGLLLWSEAAVGSRVTPHGLFWAGGEKQRFHE